MDRKNISKAQKEIDALETKIAYLSKQVAQIRNQQSGRKISDYKLLDHDNKIVRLSEMFGTQNNLIVIHNMGFSCPYCTMWADGFNAVYNYIIEKTAFVVVSHDEPGPQQLGKMKRGWKFPMYSARESTFTSDMGFIEEDGSLWPGCSVFYKNDGSDDMYLHSQTTFGPGDRFCSVFNFFDLLHDKATDEND